MSIRVVEPGAYTTVQDLGRPGYRSAGVPASGAMDDVSMRIANRLAGNADDAATLEITMLGPSLLFDSDHVVGLAGAPFRATIDALAFDEGRTARVPAGTTLQIGKAESGARAYLAFHGGIDVPPVLGSRSTFVAGGIGGVRGTALRAGDFLRIGAAHGEPAPKRAAAMRANPGVVRAMRAARLDAFTEMRAGAFWSTEFRVSPRADRTGVRLDGELVALAGPADVDPEGAVSGTIQVTSDGTPIVLGPDGPATGGYAKIATVITADLPVIAQARPGDTLRFVEVTLDEARAAWRATQRALDDAIEEAP